ncbi:hypothetical protein CapIbe_015751 [Capra ibex]
MKWSQLCSLRSNRGALDSKDFHGLEEQKNAETDEEAPTHQRLSGWVWNFPKLSAGSYVPVSAAHISQNAQREVRRLSSGLYLRKAAKVLLRKGGRCLGRRREAEKAVFKILAKTRLEPHRTCAVTSAGCRSCFK